MKLVKVWWDYDDERYSQQAFLVEEDEKNDVLYVVGEDGPIEVKHEIFTQSIQNNTVIFKEVQTDDVFALPAKDIVKLEVLEE